MRNVSNQIDYYFACDDAGSAYHIAAFVAHNYETLINKRRCGFRLGIPALHVFREFMSITALDNLWHVKKIPPETKTAIIGTGEGFERQEISSALDIGIPVLAVFDNWTNYENRLLFKGRKLKVRAILVTDNRALELSRRINSKVRTVKVENQIVKFLLSSKENKKSKNKKLLVFHQPLQKNLKRLRMKSIGIDEVINIVRTELELFLDFVKKNINVYRKEEITVRIHPSLLAKHKKLFDLENESFMISKNTLIEDLSNSNIVVGYDSYALYLSEKLKIKTVRLKIDE